MATVLQKIDRDRLKLILDRIAQYDIRFPIAEISQKLKADKGNVSSMLKGKKPVSDNFFTSFTDAYPDKNEKGFKITADRDKLIADLQKEVVKLEARVNVLMITLADIVSKVDNKAIAIVDSELTEATNREAKALLEELKKKWS